MNFFQQSINILPGIGKSNSKFYQRIGISTLKDLLFYLPKKYLSLSKEIFHDDFIVIQIKVLKKIKIKPNFFQIHAIFNDNLIIFNLFNVRFYNIFFPNKIYNIGGIFQNKEDNIYNILDLKIFNIKQKYFSLYSHSVSSYSFHKLIDAVLQLMPFNEEIYNNLDIKNIFHNLHYGINYYDSINSLKYLEAAFYLRYFYNKERYLPKNIDLDMLLRNFSYKLSSEQEVVCKKIHKDLSSTNQMQYLVYGEVGSGKTIISILSILMILSVGFNVVLLVPTVALAFQHYDEVVKLINKDDCLLYTSFTLQKNRVKEKISNGKYRVIISTHALLYLEEIPNLGLIIIDEMHKFGVAQRSKLMQSAVRKNLLMLTATPIPRSLSILLKNLMDYDILSSYNVKKTNTYWIKKDNLEILLEKVKNKKAYWILPNIEDTNDSIGVISRFEFLKQYFDKVMILHGRMKDKEKIGVIENFKNSKNAILVATTIVEIGINIPDADVLVVEQAERFGLSQLHQLRGRIGRAGQASYCFLVSQYRTKKIRYMQTYANGFDISEKDLEIRKSGRITGLVQHGCNAFYFLNEDDSDIFNIAAKNEQNFQSFDLFNGIV